jgi:hypothetical protein
MGNRIDGKVCIVTGSGQGMARHPRPLKGKRFFFEKKKQKTSTCCRALLQQCAL